MRRRTLSQRITLFATLGLGAIWVLAVTLMSVVLWSEQDELFDQQLAETAHVLLPLLSQMQMQGDVAADLTAPKASLPLDEALIYRLIARDGSVLQDAAQVSRAVPPVIESLPEDRLSATSGYQVYTTPFNAAGHALQLAAPLAERREAYREGLTGFLLPMLALLPLTWLLVGWIARRSLAPMQQLRAEIAFRDGSRLDAIDASDWPEDLARIAGTLNGFMARLTQALDAERAFATNAAHELRTPVAIALAQAQQLRETAVTEEQLSRIDALERAVQRMRRLVARLLQLARADAGIGMSSIAHDLVPMARLVLDDSVPCAASGLLNVNLPPQPVPARIDPDAFAIVLGNLIENALQHRSKDSAVTVTVRPDAVLEVTNEGPAVSSAALVDLTCRFSRQGGAGFGLGLHICTQIINQAGGRLEVISPVPGRRDGFMVRAILRRPDPREERLGSP